MLNTILKFSGVPRTGQVQEQYVLISLKTFGKKSLNSHKLINVPLANYDLSNFRFSKVLEIASVQKVQMEKQN